MNRAGVLITMCCLCPAVAAAADLPKGGLVDVRRIWDKAPHNAFTDLVRFKDHFSRYGRSIWRMLTNEEKMVMLAERENRDMSIREWLSPS